MTLLVWAGVKSSWFLEGKIVRYFGLKFQNLLEGAATASRSLEFGSARS